MNQDERAALERLLEYVGRGFCAVQSDCRLLKKYLSELPLVLPMPCTTEEFIARANSLSWAFKAHLGDLKPEPQDKDAVIAALMDRLSRIAAKKKDRAAQRLAATLPATTSSREDALLTIGSNNVERVRSLGVGESIDTATHRFTKMREGYVLVNALPAKTGIHKAVMVGTLPPKAKKPAANPRKQAPKRKR